VGDEDEEDEEEEEEGGEGEGEEGEREREEGAGAEGGSEGEEEGGEAGEAAEEGPWGAPQSAELSESQVRGTLRPGLSGPGLSVTGKWVTGNPARPSPALVQTCPSAASVPSSGPALAVSIPLLVPIVVCGGVFGWEMGLCGCVQTASAAEMVAALMRGESVAGKGKMTRRERRGAIAQLRMGLGLADLDRTPQVRCCSLFPTLLGAVRRCACWFWAQGRACRYEHRDVCACAVSKMLVCLAVCLWRFGRRGRP